MEHDWYIGFLRYEINCFRKCLGSYMEFDHLSNSRDTDNMTISFAKRMTIFRALRREQQQQKVCKVCNLQQYVCSVYPSNTWAGLLFVWRRHTKVTMQNPHQVEANVSFHPLQVGQVYLRACCTKHVAIHSFFCWEDDLEDLLLQWRIQKHSLHPLSSPEKRKWVAGTKMLYITLY